MVRKAKKEEKKPEKEAKENAEYQLFRLSETSREEIYKAGRVIGILKDRSEELYVVGPR